MLVESINNSSFFIAALVISIVILVYTFMQKRTETVQNRIFIAIVFNVAFTSFTEVCRIICLALVPQYPWVAPCIHFCQGFYFLLHNFLAFLVAWYFTVLNGYKGKRIRLVHLLFSIPAVFMVLFVITNPTLHLMYTYNADHTVSRGPASLWVYILSAMYMCIAIFQLIMYWIRMERRQWYFVVYFLGIIILGVVLQFISPSLRCELLGEALGFLGLMLVTENENDKIDATLRVYNRNALRLELKKRFRYEGQFSVIGVRIANYDILMRLMGDTGVDSIAAPVAEYLKSCFSWQQIYRVTPTDFVVLTEHDEYRLRQWSEKIYVHFLDGVFIENIETPVKVILLRALIPEELHSVDEVLLMADGPLPEYGGKGIISGDKISFFTRRTEIENALARGIVGKRFEVYYQPIHAMDDLKLCAVKALTRLHDEQLGDLMPGEFIPLAEHNGMIHQIGFQVLEEICSFISGGDPARMGIRFVNVNLSFVQCMQPDFVDKVLRLTQQYRVRPGMINFEISKPSNKMDFKMVDSVISSLKEKGFLFSMDDYGSGYSNIENIFTLDFDVVKIDRSILWGAEISENGRIILLSSIRLMKELGRQILVEGVESLEQINVLEDMDVDYLQGYYFSKPVKREELYRLVEG